jgi:hypothetical protein
VLVLDRELLPGRTVDQSVDAQITVRVVELEEELGLIVGDFLRVVVFLPAPNSNAHVLNRVFSEWLSRLDLSRTRPVGTSPRPSIEPPRTALS